MASIQNLDALRASLSSDASIDAKGDDNYAVTAARWSELNTPKPGFVVNVASEADISATVKWATQNGVPFVAQNGAHAWASWFRIDDGGIVINLRKLNTVEVDMEKGEAILGAGVTMIDALRAAKEKQAHLLLGACNAVGAIGSLLGGGSGFLVGVYGLGVDNMLSARLVGPDGAVKTVSAAENEDLWWAIRGAGHNFGIVSSATVKAHPELNGGMHYMASLAFPGTLLESVVRAVNELQMAPKMAMDMIFMRPPPDFARPAIALGLWYGGPEEEAKEAFAPLFALGGMVVNEGLVPYDHMNDHLDPVCIKGGFKPTWGLSVNSLNVDSIREAFAEYVDFSSTLGTEHTMAIFEFRATEKAFSVPLDAMAVGPALRTKKIHAFVAALYRDPALHERAKALGDSFRKKISVGEDKTCLYVNFSSGDESVEQLYGDGERLEKLRALKKKYDPNGDFNHFVPIV